MSFAVTVRQTLSAFVIFVAGFLVVLAAIIFAVVRASGSYKGGQPMRNYTVRFASQLSAEDPGIEERVSES